MPRFQGSASPLNDSWRWMTAGREQFGRAMADAQKKAIDQHLAEQEAKSTPVR